MEASAEMALSSCGRPVSPAQPTPKVELIMSPFRRVCPDEDAPIPFLQNVGVKFGAALLLASTVLFCAVPAVLTSTSIVNDPLRVRLTGSNGQLLIQWEQRPGLERAQSATLSIEDGDKVVPIELDRESLRRGSVTYAQLSSDVSVRFAIKIPNGKPILTSALLVVSPLPEDNRKKVVVPPDRNKPSFRAKHAVPSIKKADVPVPARMAGSSIRQTGSRTGFGRELSPQRSGTYRVRPGDTLSKIAMQLYGDAGMHNQIFQANRHQLSNPNRIRVGQKLAVPPGRLQPSML